jgi:hypothetical protein
VKHRPQLSSSIPLTTPTPDYTHIEVTLLYLAHGNRKGYSLSVRGVKIETQGGMTSTSFMMFSGWYQLFPVQPAPRFSAATLNKLWAALPVLQIAKDFKQLQTTGLKVHSEAITSAISGAVAAVAA